MKPLTPDEDAAADLVEKARRDLIGVLPPVLVDLWIDINKRIHQNDVGEATVILVALLGATLKEAPIEVRAAVLAVLSEPPPSTISTRLFRMLCAVCDVKMPTAGPRNTQ